MADQIQDQTKRISRILQSLMNFSHAGHHSTEQEVVNLSHCIGEAMQLLRLNKRNEDIHFINDCPEQCLTLGDAQRLVQVFVNLLGNACDASEPGGEIRATCELQDQKVVIRIEDDGHGIPADKLNRIFEPFFTTKEVGKGTGLGLALVYSIIEEHYGHISIQSPLSRGRGTCVTVTFPRYEPAHEAETE